jgi:hypothetical protein
MALAIVILPFSGVFRKAEGLGERLQVRPDEGGNSYEIFYLKGATRDEAKKLADYLRPLGYFDGNNGATVQIEKRDSDCVVSFVLQDGAWMDPEILKSFRELRSSLSREVFDSEPVVIQLCERKVVVRAGRYLDLTVRKIIRE